MTLFVLSLVATAILVVGVGLGYHLGYHLGHQDGYDLGWRDGFAAPDLTFVPAHPTSDSGVRIVGAMPVLYDQDSAAS